MFEKLKKSELQDIYLDYCLSKEEGRSCESLVSYARKYKEKMGAFMPLYVAVDAVTKMFFEEIATRYFKINFKKESE